MLQALKLPLPEGATAVLGEPLEAEPGGSMLFDQRAVALDEGALPRQPPVIGEELRMWHGIAVQEYQVFAPRPGDGLVQDSRAAEAFVGLPDVFGAELMRRRPPGENRTHPLARAVIGQQDLLRRRNLPRDGAQRPRQVIRLFMGVDDEAEGEHALRAKRPKESVRGSESLSRGGTSNIQHPTPNIQ